MHSNLRDRSRCRVLPGRPGVVCTRVALALYAALSVFASSKVVAVTLSPGDIVVSDQTVLGVFQVDPSTGDRTVFSSNSIGTGSTYNKPGGVAVESPTGVLVLEEGNREVLRVDPTLGHRIVVSSNTIGMGSTFNKPRALAFESNGGTLAAVAASACSGIMHHVCARGGIN